MALEGGRETLQKVLLLDQERALGGACKQLLLQHDKFLGELVVARDGHMEGLELRYAHNAVVGL